MNNQTEEFRVEPQDGVQGGVVQFDWATGDMKATWDDGSTETWPNHGCSVESKAEAYFYMTDQLDRLKNVQ